MILRLLDAEDGPELQRVLEMAPDYSHRVTGLPVGEADAVSLFSMLPPDKTYDDKFVYGIFAPELVGVLDVIRGYPNPSTAFIGLLLIADPWQGGGVGARAFQDLLGEVAGWPAITTLRLAIVDTNAQVTGFWQKLGFVATGESKPYTYAALHSTARLYERPVAGPWEVAGRRSDQ